MKVLVLSPIKGLTRFENDEFNFFSKKNIALLEESFEVLWNETGRAYTKEEICEKIRDVDAVFTFWGTVQLDEDIINCAEKLKIVVHLGGTVNSYISPAVYKKGIMVISANDLYFARSVAEGTLTYALVALRKLRTHILNMREKREAGWSELITEMRGLLGKTVGIVSYGAIARHFAEMLQPFGCKIKVYSRSIDESELKRLNMERVSLEELFSTCDVISVHTAFNEHTKHMINEDLIKRIHDGAVFINTSRGAIVDEEALCRELKSGRFMAALDVFEKEPLPNDSPLYDMDNVLIIPHKGGPTQDVYPILTRGLIEEMKNYLFEGEIPKSRIDENRAFTMSFK